MTIVDASGTPVDQLTLSVLLSADDAVMFPTMRDDWRVIS